MFYALAAILGVAGVFFVRKRAARKKQAAV
jgi:hypothetical protein